MDKRDARSPIAKFYGWYWLCLLANAAPQISTNAIGGYPGMQSSGDRDVMYNTKAITYGALGATGPTSWGSSVTYSGNNQPWAGYK